MSNHFKTQQEIWKYVADGGAVISTRGRIIKFISGSLIDDYDFCDHEDWKPYIAPVPKTKVWRWEDVARLANGEIYVSQTISLFSEKHAFESYPGYTKVPNSEREI